MTRGFSMLASTALAFVVLSACGSDEPDSNDSGGGSGGATGGSAASGGSSGAATGGTGATSGTATGGTATGGASGAAPGGMSGAGGSAGSTAGGCSSVPTACTAPTVRITDVTFGVDLVGNGGEGETQPIPLAIAAKPNGGSRVAAMGTDGRVYVGELDCDDHLVGAPVSFPANDFQDIALDSSGGVLLLTRDAEGGGTLNCGTPSNLCDGGPEDPIPCYDMWLVRFDANGTEQWAAKLTTASASLPPYSTGPTGATVHMIWWYQHHGRLASDGKNYAAYFGVAITVQNGDCVDIHEGDRMQVVDAKRLAGQRPRTASRCGCSHSWTTRIVWDPRTCRFVMVCATDNDSRIARPPNYQTIYSSAPRSAP